MSDQCEVTGCKAVATWSEHVRNAGINRVVHLCADCRHQLLTPYLPDPPLKEAKAVLEPHVALTQLQQCCRCRRWLRIPTQTGKTECECGTIVRLYKPQIITLGGAPCKTDSVATAEPR